MKQIQRFQELNVFITQTPEVARQQAAQVDQRLAKGGSVHACFKCYMRTIFTLTVLDLYLSFKMLHVMIGIKEIVTSKNHTILALIWFSNERL